MSVLVNRLISRLEQERNALAKMTIEQGSKETFDRSSGEYKGISRAIEIVRELLDEADQREQDDHY